MKYSASTTLVDDDGNVILERELTDQEIIQLLIDERVGKFLVFSPEAHAAALEEGFKKLGGTSETLRGRPKKNGKVNGGKGRPKSDRTCGNCGTKGHTSPTCPEKGVRGGAKASKPIR